MTLKTKSFELAVFARGDEGATRLAILIPGRLDTKNYINFVRHAEYLAKLGFYVIAFDPPGTWESAGDIETYTTGNYIKAINELIDYFGNRPTLLLGHSRGGSAAILASSNPAVFAIALVLANYEQPSPPTEESIKRGFQMSYRDIPPGDHKTSEQKEFRLPLSYWEESKRYNPMEMLIAFNKPKLLISGTKDEFYSPQEVEEVYRSIPEPKILRVIESAHDYRYYPQAVEAVNGILGEFLGSIHQ